MVKDALDLIKRQQAEIEKLKSIQLKQGNIIDSLRGDKYECIGTIDAFKKKFELADETINQIEDALDRGVDNSWAREHIDEYREKMRCNDG
jgi:ArsR family metal-binding transcriptional regulator